MKFDLSSVKLDSVFTIFLSFEAEASNLLNIQFYFHFLYEYRHIN